MINRLTDLFFSLKTTFVVSLLYIIAQIYATLGFASDADAWLYVYGTKWFEIIQWIISINLIGIMYKYKTYKKLPIFILHLSVIVIFIGAGITRYWGDEGVLHLRIGQETSVITLQNKANPADVGILDMGFKVKLDRFVMNKYPGSDQASSYESYVIVTDGKKSFPYHIYMNHILNYKGFRIYQMAYDPDEKGSIFLVGRDPGIFMTYLGYILLTLGFLLSMFYKKSKFMATVKKLRKSGLFTILLTIGVLNSYSYGMDIKDYAQKSKDISKQFATLLIQYNGRVKPVDSLNLDLVHKLTKKSKIDGMDYNQIIMGIITYPNMFKNEKIIYVGHPAIRKLLGLQGKYATYADFFDNFGQLKYKKEMDKAFQTPDRDRTKDQREWLKLEERLVIFNIVASYDVFKIFPDQNAKSENYKWYSVNEMKKLDPMIRNFYYSLFNNLINGLGNFDKDRTETTLKKIAKIQKMYSADIIPSPKRVEMEIKYNHLNIFPSLIGVYSLLGLIAILIGFFEIFKEQKLKKIELTLLSLGGLALLIHTINMILRWYVSGHAPWSNAYESIVFIAWGSAFASIFFFKKNPLALGAGLFMAGMFMMVAHLNNIDPQITNMVPVLKSYWLLIHVAVITSSYGFLAVGAMLGFLNIILFGLRKYKNLDNQIKEVNDIIYLSFYMGLGLLSVGTFLGGVWANESWGRYWSWDPKETWSLITMIAYALVIHTKMIPKMTGQFIFSVLAFLSFFFILMTYFGVNFYIAQGLHAYGRGEGDATWFNVLKGGIGVWFMVVVATLIIAITQHKSKK